jgi:hypothetical protein
LKKHSAIILLQFTSTAVESRKKNYVIMTHFS